MNKVNEINKGNPLERTLCPITPARLHEMYWKEGKTLNYIGGFTANIQCREKSFSEAVVSKWLEKIGVKTRTPSEYIKLSIAKNPRLKEVSKANLAKAREKGLVSLGQPVDEMRKLQKKAVRASRAIRKSRRVHFICACGCGRGKSIPPCQVNPKGLNFFSISCSSKYYNKQRSLNALRTVNLSEPEVFTFEQLARMSEEQMQKITTKP